RHRRIVVLLRIVVDVHAQGTEAAVRRVVAGAAGRDLPLPARRAIDLDGHLLGGLVHRDENGGVLRGRREGGGRPSARETCSAISHGPTRARSATASP